MENKELITRAKEIILKGAKQENIELPEFEIDLNFLKMKLINAVSLNNPKMCLVSAFEWDANIPDSDVWTSIHDKLPTTINN